MTQAEAKTTVNKAKLRMAKGNPPGKKNSLGDAINWELLLEEVDFFGQDELVIISSDGDFESELTPGAVKEFLQREWKSVGGKGIRLFKNLPSFLREFFPDIELSEENEKTALIEGLEESGNFATTHALINQLNRYDDFTDQEVKQILKAYSENSQISWIITDEDVEADFPPPLSRFLLISPFGENVVLDTTCQGEWSLLNGELCHFTPLKKYFIPLK